LLASYKLTPQQYAYSKRENIMNQTLKSLLMLALFYSSNALALSCIPIQLNLETLDAYSDIVEATVLDYLGPGDTHWMGEASAWYRVKINQQWKGSTSPNAEVKLLAHAPWGGGKAYEVGGTYLVFAKRDNGMLSTGPGWCGPDIYPRQQLIEALNQAYP